MNNFKKTIAKNFILFPSFILFIVNILFLDVGVNTTSMNTNCFLDCYGVGVVGILFFVSLVGIIIFFIPPKRRPPKILFFSFFLSSVVIAMLFSKYFDECKRSHFDSNVGVICENVLINKEETDTKKSNKEWEVWKKCTHLLSSFSFEYPSYLKITKEDKQYNYWQIAMESPDFSYKDKKRNLYIASGFYLSITANPVADMTFAEFKNLVDPKDPNRDRSGIVWIEKKSRQFFTQTSERSSKIADSENIFDYSLNTLYNPNLMISAVIMGTQDNKEEMEKILNHFMETLE